MLRCLRNHKLYINVEGKTSFQRRNNIISSALNQRQNLTLKRH